MKKKEEKKPKTSYLIRGIDREFWARVKSSANLKQVTVREFTLDALKEKVDREKK